LSDDDPTGSQTVHSCLLLTRWDLAAGISRSVADFLVLTNTRRSPDKAASVTREVCRNLKQALLAEGIQDFLIVSRSDSTCGALPNRDGCCLLELGPIDAHLSSSFEGDGSPATVYIT